MPERTEVFNLRDAAVEIEPEDIDGVPTGSPLTTDWLYVDSAILDDQITVRKSFQGGAVGRRNTTISHLYSLALSRFHAKFQEDFGIVDVSADDTYQISLVVTNEQFPDFNETHVLKHCQIEARAIRFGSIVNNVPTRWAVGEYVKPT